MQAAKKEDNGCRIYVACLAAYNAGKLHGVWIDVEGKDAFDIQEEVAEMLEASPVDGAEEWAIHDSEGLPGVGESSSFEEVANIAEIILEHGEAGAAILDYHGGAAEYAIQSIRNGFAEYEDRSDYAHQLTEDIQGDISSWLLCYIDWDSVGRDLLMDRCYADLPSGGIVVFDS